MRKLFALLTIVLFAGFMMAQSNTATVQQTGDNQNANVSQVGSVNKSTVTQFTDNSGAQQSDVIQSGVQNESWVTQNQTGGGSNTPANTAYIKQIGNNNFGYQFENAPGYNSGQTQSAEQYGSDNTLNQTISQGYTTGQISYQNGNHDIATQNHNSAYQFSNIQTWGDYSEAHQTADGTKANLHIAQYGGNYNYAKQNFSGNFAFVPGNTGDIIQNGAGNSAYQTLTGTEHNSMDLVQTGNNNYSDQVQTGDNNTSSTIQTGNTDQAISYQYDGVVGNTAAISQTGGNTNYGYINQTGDSNNASITSDGSNHYGSITQTGGMNEAVVTQHN